MAIVYLPIVLISLWSPGDLYNCENINNHASKVLGNSMQLFSTACLVGLNNMSQRCIEAYQVCIIAYLANIQTLYSHVTLRLNVHMAVHVNNFLKQFGPAHSWWCFSFERLIGILQRQPSNHIHSKMICI